ncbi:G-protein coupled receptor 157-like [Ylistrum balloti]|uniref:G-protein coupled receptor 157-like n=1 Tax=Ylistrum balloti TaxID=509963 RepID=UPI0029059AB1|nr:G-protein coupled receptor 157-like [Ylistrum balloti]
MSSDLETTTSIITFVSALLSVLSGFAILWSYRQFPETQNYTRYLLVCLTVADISTAFGNFISTFRWFSIGITDGKTDAYCAAQSFITTTSTLSSFFWTTAIAIYLFCAVVLRINIAEKRRAQVLMTIIPVLVPVTITSVALAYDVLGEDDYNGSGPWCWIKQNASHQIMWKLVTGKAWEGTTYIITLVIYVLLKFFKWRENRRSNRQFRWSNTDPRLRDADSIFEISWLFLLVARIWGTLRFTLQTANISLGTGMSNAFLYMQCIGDSSQAFWNFLFFFTLDSELRTRACPGRCRSRRDRERDLNNRAFRTAEQAWQSLGPQNKHGREFKTTEQV